MTRIFTVLCGHMVNAKSAYAFLTGCRRLLPSLKERRADQSDAELERRWWSANAELDHQFQGVAQFLHVISIVVGLLEL